MPGKAKGRGRNAPPASRKRSAATKTEGAAAKAVKRGRKDELPENLKTGDAETDALLARVRGMGRDAAVAMLVVNGWPPPVAKAFVTMTVKYYDAIGAAGRWALRAVVGKAKKAGGEVDASKLKAAFTRSKKKKSNKRRPPPWARRKTR